MMKELLVVLSLSLLLLVPVVSVSAQTENNFGENVREDYIDKLKELQDKMTYMCMQGEAYEELDTLTDKEKKKCEELLDKADYFDRQKLIEKYGKLDYP